MAVSWPWVSTWEHHVRRLRELQVRAQEVYPPRAASLLKRFAEEFTDPDRGGELLVDRDDRAVDFERHLRLDCTAPARASGSLAWLRGGGALTCVRLDRRPGLPALEIDTTTMQEAWAVSWPGAFVNFGRARALVISVDYEAFRCDLRGRRGTPYR